MKICWETGKALSVAKQNETVLITGFLTSDQWGSEVATPATLLWPLWDGPLRGGRWSSVTINTWLSQAFCRNNGNLWWGMTPEPVGSGAAWSSRGMMKGTSWLDGWPRGSGLLPVSADDLPISDGVLVCVCVVAVLRSDVSFRLRCRVKNWLVNRKKKSFVNVWEDLCAFLF